MLYTRKGDCGRSSLIGESDISKDNIIFEILGTVDELSAFLAMAKLVCADDVAAQLEKIQRQLIDVGTAFAGGREFDFSKAVEEFEEKIDFYERQNVCPDGLILYGKNEPGARCDAARAVCRRAERLVVKHSSCADCPKNAVAYFNRLSDYLFITARFLEKGREL